MHLLLLAAAGFVGCNTRSLLIRRYHSISLPDSATIRAVPSFAHRDGFDYVLLAADALPSDYFPWARIYFIIEVADWRAELLCPLWRALPCLPIHHHNSTINQRLYWLHQFVNIS
jgi:hypothetical protein